VARRQSDDKIGTLSDPHAGIADQQHGIATEIVTAKELLL
jgi:hypothetical protein